MFEPKTKLADEGSKITKFCLFDLALAGKLLQNTAQ